MIPRDALKTALVLSTVLATGRAFLLPLLFPVSIKITINRKHSPPPKPDYHFSTVPVYKEVVVKGSIEPGFKHSYGDGHKYGTSYGDGHIKVYTNEPHIKGHKYSKGYGTGSAVHFPGPSSTHYKGTEYVEDPHSHNKGSAFVSFEGSYQKGTPHQHYPGAEYVQPDGHHKGTDFIVQNGHHKGTEYIQPIAHHKGTEYIQPNDHHQGTEYVIQDDHQKLTEYVQPNGHHKGTEYIQPGGHHQGTEYIQPNGHHKGTEYIQPGGHLTGSDYGVPEGHHKGTQYIQPGKGGSKPYNKQHSYIKSVGGYKMADYLPVSNGGQHSYDDKVNGYVSHVAIPPKVQPGHTYADISNAHKAVHAPKAYDAKEYADLGEHQYKPVQDDYADESGYLDDSLPAYKYPPTLLYSKRNGQAAPHKDEPTLYAGFGTTVYGDSYAKVVYRPKHLRISISAHRH